MKGNTFIYWIVGKIGGIMLGVIISLIIILQENKQENMSEIELKNPKYFSESWDELPEEVKIACKQSAEALEERLFLAQLSQSKTTYLVFFDNGCAYGHVSAIDLYNFQKLKMQYNQIINDREEYLQTLQREQFDRAIINTKEIAAAHKMKMLETEPYLNEIIKKAQLFTMPFNREIEKIIDETTNTVVLLFWQQIFTEKVMLVCSASL